MIGELICDKYKVEAVFCESHIYEIFMATEAATGATVVLKILKEEMAISSERVKIFSEEIRSFASISHPMVAEILDVDMFEDRPFVVTPMVQGKDLLSVIREQTLSFEESCRIIQSLATLLQYAADEKVEHRNIKLSNVLLDKENRLKLLSFTHPRLKLIAKNSRSENPGVHSDLYFLGTTFFELLAGESAIRRRGGINELWDMKLEKLLRIRHSELTPEQIGNVVDFVRRAITRDMKKRFSSHEEFLKSLADLFVVFRKNTIRSKAKQLSMASQVVDALNGRSSKVDVACVVADRAVAPVSDRQAAVARAAECRSGSADSVARPDFVSGATCLTQGNLALVVDNNELPVTKPSEGKVAPAAKSSRPGLKLVKSVSDTESAQLWGSAEEKHWLRNPVIIMGLCLVVMVFLILFW